MRPSVRRGRLTLLGAASLVQIGRGALERQGGGHWAQWPGVGFGAGLQGQAGRDRGELGVGLGLECWPGLLWRWRCWLLGRRLEHKLGLQVL